MSAPGSQKSLEGCLAWGKQREVSLSPAFALQKQASLAVRELGELGVAATDVTGACWGCSFESLFPDSFVGKLWMKGEMLPSLLKREAGVLRGLESAS